MAIGLSDAFSEFAPLETPRPLPRAAVDSLARLDGEALRKVVADAAARMLDSSLDHSRSHTAGDEEDPHPMTATVDLQQSTAAAACVLARCAREVAPEMSASAVRQVVADCGVDDEPLLTQLIPLVTPYIAAIRAALQATSFDFAHVVDVSWRLDYVLRSSAAGNVHEPVYYVQLTVQPPQGMVHTTTFACSVEGLRDLVYRLQDATNAIEKIAGATRSPVAAAIA